MQRPKVAPHLDGGITLDGAKGNITVKDVTFSYPHRDTQILKVCDRVSECHPFRESPGKPKPESLSLWSGRVAAARVHL